jgi:hypothetical protein
VRRLASPISIKPNQVFAAVGALLAAPGFDLLLYRPPLGGRLGLCSGGSAPLNRLHHHKMTLDEKSFSIKAPMAEHIEDLQQRFAELNKRIQLVRSFL